ncbi:MAG: MFS transporter [Candidatus Nitrosocosmicus sp.]
MDKKRSTFRDKSVTTLVILSIIGLIVMYVETMVSPALPDLIKDFNISYSSASWNLTSYLVVAVVTTPILGRLSDIYGRKKILLIGLIIYAIGTLLAGFSTNIIFMIVARAAEGIGIGIFPVAVAIVRNHSSEEKLGFNQGIITSMFATGAVIGLAAGGTIVHYFGWRATFFTIIPIVIILISLVARFVDDKYEKVVGSNNKPANSIPITNSNENKEKIAYSQNKNPHSGSKIDIKGAIAFSIGIISILLVITNFEPRMSVVNITNISLLASIGIISMIFFIYTEKRVQSPLIDFKIVLNKILLSANVLRMVAGLFMFSILNTMPILIRNPKPFGFGESAINAATIIVPFMAAYLVVGLSAGFILSRLGNSKVVLVGSGICAIGFAVLSLSFQSIEPLLVSLVVLGIGSQLLHQGAININLVSTPKNLTGISFGISNVFYLMGSAIGPTVVGMYMQTNQASANLIHGSFPTSESYLLIFYTGVILSIITMILSAFVMKKIKVSYTELQR